MGINSRIKRIRKIIKRLPNIIEWLLFAFPEKKRFGYFGKNSLIDYPTYIYEPKSFYLFDNAKVKRELKVINSPGEKVTIKKYTSIAANCTIVIIKNTNAPAINRLKNICLRTDTLQ